MFENTNVRTELDEINRAIVQRELEDRRRRLHQLPPSGLAAATEALVVVDQALERLEGGSFGACSRCDGHVEAERLIANPLATVCLECLTGAERGALERDLALASQVQATLLPPRTFATVGWTGHYTYTPHGTVGGDYVDVIMPAGGNGDVFVFVGDISGKGVAAAMLMSHLHAAMRAMTNRHCSLGDLLAKANVMLHGASMTSLYATLAAVRLSADGTVEIATAGHPPLFLVSTSGARPLSTPGLPIGLFAGAEYTTKTVSTEPGDAVVLYTDGVSESVDAEDRELGVQSIGWTLDRSTQTFPKALVQSVESAASSHRGGAQPSDDVTVAAIQRCPTAEMS